MASSPLRPTTAAGSVPYWRVALAALRSSSLLGHDYFDRFRAERFQFFFAAFLATYFATGVLVPLSAYIWVLRSPWLLAVAAVCTGQCGVLGVALRLARHSRYEQSITLVCIGNWAGCLFVTFVTPALLPVAVLGALVPVVFAEPYVRWQRGLVLAVITVGCVLALGALARFQNVSHLAGHPPRWIETALIFALLPISAVFILVIVWGSATALRTVEGTARRARRPAGHRRRRGTAPPRT